MLQARSAKVTAYDPAAADNALHLLSGLTISESPYDAAEDADALCVLTPWNELRQARMSRVVESMRNPLLLDGRNNYDALEMRGPGIRIRRGRTPR